MPTPPTPGAKRDVVLHIGMGKTGTSSLQTFLHRNRGRLADLGILYPKSPGRTRHTRLGLSFRPVESLANSPSWNRLDVDAPPKTFRYRSRRQLVREMDRADRDRVLFSDEGLYGLPDEGLHNLASFMEGLAKSLRVVVYLRRQDDHLVSLYQQQVKVGETKRLAEQIQRPHLAKGHDYAQRLGRWKSFVAPDQFVVRRFERDAFVDGSLYQDFLEAAGIDKPADEFRQIHTRNESLDAEAVEFLRIVNLLRDESPSSEDVPRGNHEMIPRLVEASTGPVLTLPAQVLDDYMARWEESNRQVTQEFLGDDAGQLFHMPRKQANTTIEQRLDPARLDHYFTLLTIPEQLHGPLRKIAEREAPSL